MRKRAAERMGQEPPELQRKQGRSHQSGWKQGRGKPCPYI